MFHQISFKMPRRHINIRNHILLLLDWFNLLTRVKTLFFLNKKTSSKYEWRVATNAFRKEAEEMIILIFSRRGEEKMGNERCYIVIEILRFRSRDREGVLALNRPCYRGEWKPGSRKKPDRSCSVNFSTAPRFLRHARAFYGSLLKLITFRQTCFLSLPPHRLASFLLSLFLFFF